MGISALVIGGMLCMILAGGDSQNLSNLGTTLDTNGIFASGFTMVCIGGGASAIHAGWAKFGTNTSADHQQTAMAEFIFLGLALVFFGVTACGCAYLEISVGLSVAALLCVIAFNAVPAAMQSNGETGLPWGAENTDQSDLDQSTTSVNASAVNNVSTTSSTDKNEVYSARRLVSLEYLLDQIGHSDNHPALDNEIQSI